MSHYEGITNGNEKSEKAEDQAVGYKGFYSGLTEDDLRALKRLKPGELFSGLEISTDDIFIAVQTEAALKRNHVQGEEEANKTRLEVERKVREFVADEARGSSSEQLLALEKGSK